jgi:hypothetical protein
MGVEIGFFLILTCPRSCFKRCQNRKENNMQHKDFKPRVGTAVIKKLQHIIRNSESKNKGAGVRAFYFILAYAYSAMRVEDTYGLSFWSQNQWDGSIVNIPISKKNIRKWYGKNNRIFFDTCTKLKGVEVADNKPYNKYIYFSISKGNFFGAIKEVAPDEPLSYVSYLDGEETLPWQQLFLLKCIQASCQKEQTLNFDTLISYKAFLNRKDKQKKHIIKALKRFVTRGYLEYEIFKEKIKITPRWRDEEVVEAVTTKKQNVQHNVIAMMQERKSDIVWEEDPLANLTFTEEEI